MLPLMCMQKTVRFLVFENSEVCKTFKKRTPPSLVIIKKLKSTAGSIKLGH